MKKIAIHSVPRSGSSWIGQIFNSSSRVCFKYQPLFSYAFKDYLNEQSSLEDINNFFKNISNSKDPFLNQEEQIKKGYYPQFEKNGHKEFIIYKEVRYHNLLKNLLEKDKDLKVIGIIRNPLAVIHSWWKAPKEFKAELGWKIEEEWRWAPLKNQNRPEEFNGYEKWKEVALLFEELKEKYPNRFYLLKYIDLCIDPYSTTKDLFEFCQIPFEEQTVMFLRQSQEAGILAEDPYSVYRSSKKETDDKWRNGLPYLIVEEIQRDLKNSILEKYL
ncbi:MAG: sulfotransferase domain-containing protein [Chitinophagaceae bacterium]|nr:sulfotransferase domain-containing protein [Chitinophagaceae bacterium]